MGTFKVEINGKNYSLTAAELRKIKVNQNVAVSYII